MSDAQPHAKYFTVSDDGTVLSFDQTRWLAKTHGSCLFSCLGILVMGWLLFAGVLVAWQAAAIMGGLIVLDLIATKLRQPLEREVTLSTSHRVFTDRMRNRFGTRTNETRFDDIGCVQFHIDHDPDCIEYKVKLGNPSIYKVCEIKDDQEAARAVAQAIADFTRLPIEDRVEDAGKHR